MELTEEIKAAARQLGQSLRHDEYVRAYLDALGQYQQDAEAVALEERLYAQYQAMIGRQQSGESLNPDDLQAFNEHRYQVQTHPLMARRDDLLRRVKPYLAQVAEEISFPLGVDFAALAKPQ